MDKQIRKLVDIYFDTVPYSSDSVEVREKIEASLTDEYKKLSGNMTKDKALETLIGKYGKLSDMANLAGYSAADAEKWRCAEDIFNLKAIKKEVSKQRRRIYFSALFAVGGFVQVLWILYNMLFLKSFLAIYNLIFSIILFSLSCILLIKYRKTDKSSLNAKYDNDSFMWLLSISDRYAKRKLNSIALMFAAFSVFFFSEISFYISGNSKSTEFIESIFANIVVIEIPMYLYIKNFLCLKMLQRRIALPKKEKYKKHTLGVLIFSAAYWFAAAIVIPWCFTYGNHDTENLASASKSELNEIYKSLSYKTSGNLLYPYVQPDVTGRNNQLIEVRNSDGTLNTALFLIDSNAYTGEGINVYDYIHDDQVDWYANEVKRLCSEEGHTVNSLVFFHIPLQQYRTAYELYESGSAEVKYFFGENDEKTIDKVCCSKYPSKLFDRMAELKSTTGTFCGHDHYNNMSLEYKGIRLTYGMSIDYLAMPGIEKDTPQRGAELITLHPDGSWDLEQIPLKLAQSRITG